MDELRIFWYKVGLIQKEKRISDERLAHLLGISRATLARHRADVLQTTGSELAKASRHFGESIPDLMTL